jgi:hypothetical protein
MLLHAGVTPLLAGYQHDKTPLLIGPTFGVLLRGYVNPGPVAGAAFPFPNGDEVGSFILAVLTPLRTFGFVIDAFCTARPAAVLHPSETTTGGLGLIDAN